MTNPFSMDPKSLENARTLCHLVCQWPSKAARANLAPLDDDSHSNLGWLNKYAALVSHPLDADGSKQLGFSFATSALIWLEDSELVERLDLHSETDVSVAHWVDGHLAAAVRVLGAWYDYGRRALENLVEEFGAQCVEMPTVRCWPHHFDLGSLFVLEAGASETARSIGVGLAPGDGSFAEPYFYCSPYPALAENALLPLLTTAHGSARQQLWLAPE